MKPSKAVEQFHVTYGLPVTYKPVIPDTEQVLLRENLLEEEYREYVDASWRGDLVEIADALADMIYIIHGTALVYGLPLDEIFDEVHRSNMSKLDENGNVVRRDDGKVLKGKNFEPPRIAEILDRKTRTTD